MCILMRVLSNSLILLTVVMKQKTKKIVFYPSVKWPVIANFFFSQNQTVALYS